MSRLTALLLSCLLLLPALPALAQGIDRPGPGRGPGWDGAPMMWGRGGWDGGGHPMMIFGPFLMLLALIGIVALIVWLVRHFGPGRFHHGQMGGFCPHCGQGGGRRAQEILAERFARGEIDKADYEEKRRLLGG